MSRKRRIPTLRKHPSGYGFIYHRLVGTKDHRMYFGKYVTDEWYRYRLERFARLHPNMRTHELRPYHPVVTIPLGYSTEGLPIGGQLVGHRWKDLDLLEVAKAVSGRCSEVRRPARFACPESEHN